MKNTKHDIDVARRHGLIWKVLSGAAEVLGKENEVNITKIDWDLRNRQIT